MIIKTINLCKKFKDKLAVNNLNIHVYENEIYAFLGLNGAGKSTTIKMLTGLISSSKGTAIINNYDLVKDISKIKEISSICPQETALSMKLTVFENIYLMGKIYNINKEELINRTNELIKIFSLEDYKNILANKLSGGYQKRLSICMSLVSNPKILYLDEPTLGLDVISRRELWKLILKLKKSMTIVLTTHYLEEVEALANNIGIIKDGNLIFEGKLDNLYQITNENNIENAFIKISGGEI